MQLYEWNEELCRHYADGLRPMVPFDHAPWAEKIALRLAGLPVNATVLDAAMASAAALDRLQPKVLAPGHGLPSSGEAAAPPFSWTPFQCVSTTEA